ncbi:MAG: hypothetical protein U0746_19710 [Gemmataceae bacterium]
MAGTRYVVALVAVYLAFHAALIAGVAGWGEPAGPPTGRVSVAVARIVATDDTQPIPSIEADDEPVGTEAVAAPTPAAPATPADDSTAAKAAPEARPIGPLPAPRWTPAELQASLLQVPEVSLPDPAATKVYQTGRASGWHHPTLAIIAARPDLRDLPVRRGAAAVLPPDEADALRDTSVLVRKGLGDLAGQATQNRKLQFHPEVLAAQPGVAARVMHQMIQVQSVPLRKALVAQLSKVRDATAAKALAHRAVYEPTAEVRRAALTALARRPALDYLPVLLAAFRSPWPPAADHAADALAELAPAEAVSELVRCLDEPATVPELVRVNHARNCLLCHAQSVDSGDGVRVAVPSPTRPLPSPFSLDGYEGGGRGGSRVPRGTVFARPDVTYLQQEFSWVLPVANPGPWPALQRYDFVVRPRPVDAAAPPSDSPQRRAVVRALAALTGQDFGDRAADWRAGLGRNGG